MPIDGIRPEASFLLTMALPNPIQVDPVPQTTDLILLRYDQLRMFSRGSQDERIMR